MTDFECKICEKGYTSKRNLKRHEEAIHSIGENTWSCEFCDKTFKIEDYLLT